MPLTRRLSLALPAAAAVLALGTLAGPVCAAQLVNSSGSCVDIQRNDTHDGTPLILFHCHGSPNQNWVVSGGTISGEGGVCVDVLGSAPNEGAQIIIVQCNGRPSQKWQVVNGQLIGLGNKCLDLQGASSADRTPLILSTCNTGSPGQQWSIQ
jgi:Ricin-type beta-trefoil lectin domain